MRECKHCGRELPQQLRGRPREVCDACKPNRVAVLAAVADAPPAPAPAGEVPPLVEATRRRLAAAGRLDTVEGAAALLLAAKAESRLTNASQAAAAVRELRITLEAALAGAKAADAVDSLADRRRRVSGA